MEKNQTVLKIAQIIQGFRFLEDGLEIVFVDLEGRFGILKGVLRLAQQDVAFTAGYQGSFLCRIQFQRLYKRNWFK